MGKGVAHQEFSREDRTRYREKVRRCLDVFARMLRESRFDADSPMTGLEIELNLVDELGDPALKNAEALEAIADPDFQTELGQFNLEINVAPKELRDRGFTEFEDGVRASLNDAESKAAKVGAHMVMIGILPTLSAGHMSPASLTPNPRYQLLSDQILAARGEDIVIDIAGPERLRTTTDSIVPEAACTSTQLHIQVSPGGLSGLLERLTGGRRRPARDRCELALPARSGAVARDPDPAVRAGHRHPQRGAQGAGRAPAVWFGERWINSVFDLFEENVRYFPALLPIMEDEDPLVVLESGRTPTLGELRLHNGTVYRWNRPVYDVVDGRPHLRVENRVLPAGPTVADTMANAAFYFGLVRTLAEQQRPLWSQMSFSAAEENFHVAAQYGIEANVYWPGLGQVPATELVVRRLLPMARAGLESWGVLRDERDRLLGIIEQRCVVGQNGASWFADRFHSKVTDNDGDRLDALRRTLNEYREHMHTNEPVHTWE